MADKKLLDIRTRIKKRKPVFKRPQTHQFAKLRNNLKWRRPRGLDNKTRLQRRGKPAMPAVGFKSPKEVRGLNREGKVEVLVHNVNDLEKVDKNSVALIGAKVGKRKRISILEAGKEKSVAFANIKDIDATIQSYKKEEKSSEKKDRKNKGKQEEKATSKDEEKSSKEDSTQEESQEKEESSKTSKSSSTKKTSTTKSNTKKATSSGSSSTKSSSSSSSKSTKDSKGGSKE